MVDALSPQPLSSQELSRLIGSIYDCALDPSRWEQALAEIKDVLCCHAAILHLDDIPHERALINRAVGIAPYWLEQQASFTASHF